MGLVRDLQAEIEARSLPKGGWASGNGRQASVETTCYGLMALYDRPVGACKKAVDFLVRVRNRDGSWPAFEGDDAEGCWTTALALIALRYVNSSLADSEKSLSWLLESKGREAHWFWRWKFKTADREVHFNPDKFGWPWFPGTVSWIIPTAFALIALRQWSPCCRAGLITNRILLGKEMFRDRACPQGGWNAGNGIVFGAALKPHIDSTAIALLALTDSSDSTATNGLKWLCQAFIDCSSVYSLSWTAFAFLVHGHTPLNRCLLNLHRALSAKSLISNVEALSLAVIAINAAQGDRNPFMVI